MFNGQWSCSFFAVVGFNLQCRFSLKPEAYFMPFSQDKHRRTFFIQRGEGSLSQPIARRV